jgi:hypothetical protein
MHLARFNAGGSFQRGRLASTGAAFAVSALVGFLFPNPAWWYQSGFQFRINRGRECWIGASDLARFQGDTQICGRVHFPRFEKQQIRFELVIIDTL